MNKKNSTSTTSIASYKVTKSIKILHSLKMGYISLNLEHMGEDMVDYGERYYRHA